MTAAAPADHIIEGEYRVVETRTVSPRRSPNRRRAAVRILCWNAIFVGAAITIPVLFG